MTRTGRMPRLTVVDPGPFATIQDLGRPGHAHLGVPESGAADRGSLMLANRLVGNPEGAAAIETTLGRCTLRALDHLLIAVTGAATTVRVDGVPAGSAAALPVPAGATISVDMPARGCRNYVAIRGGIDAPATLGSRSTDTLCGLGPPPLRAGDELTVGVPSLPLPPVSSAPVGTDIDDVVSLEVLSGPRESLVRAPGDLRTGIWVVSAESNRVGVRLDRAPASAEPLLHHVDDAAELASEGISHGAVQVPPSGRPVIFLADHPVTGGYPVIGVLTRTALDRAAQVAAGQHIRFG